MTSNQDKNMSEKVKKNIEIVEKVRKELTDGAPRVIKFGDGKEVPNPTARLVPRTRIIMKLEEAFESAQAEVKKAPLGYLQRILEIVKSNESEKIKKDNLRRTIDTMMISVNLFVDAIRKRAREGLAHLNYEATAATQVASDYAESGDFSIEKFEDVFGKDNRHGVNKIIKNNMRGRVVQ